ncbi:hypothetical protein ZWY2020_036271 [Hordeum vulgare]|nr:hypothetical protein ZWY2020_036271 [Hordeum vulgare]
MSSAALSLSTSVGALVSPATVMAPATVSVPALSVRLGRTNFLLWKGISNAVLAGANLHGYLDGTEAAPAKLVDVGAGDNAATTANPA